MRPRWPTSSSSSRDISAGSCGPWQGRACPAAPCLSPEPRAASAPRQRSSGQAGRDVALVGLEPDLLEKVAAECGANAAVFEADVTVWDALERAAEGTVERFGEIYAVVANAGIGAAGTIREIDPAPSSAR